MGAAAQPGRRQRATFVCQACGQVSSKWLGRCPGCEAWATMAEEAAPPPASAAAATAPQVARLAAVGTTAEARLSCGLAELDRVLGGGLVPGSLVLVGGDPGIGKSTLLLQAAAALAAGGQRVLYVSGEESPAQVKLRADRLGLAPEQLFLCAATSTEGILAAKREVEPHAMVVDSVQTIRVDEVPSAAGSVAQIRAVTQRLVEWAKAEGTATFVVGHVTKEGSIAGPRVMEHMVDAVLYLEGERSGPYRVLRAHKNRFGSAQEMAVFEMQGDGLAAVANPSALFLAERAGGPGACAVTSVEGSRPLVVEVQALVTPAFLGGTPRRTTQGFDPQRTALLCAVLGARAGVDLAATDVFVNVAGGARLHEPAADLGVALALASAAREHALPESWVAIGEVGLAGEVRSCHNLTLRLREAAALGFTTAVVPARRLDEGRGRPPLDLMPVARLGDALAACRIPRRRRGGSVPASGDD